MVKYEELQQMAANITGSGTPAVVTPSGVPGIVIVAIYGAEQTLTRLNAFWYLYGITQTISQNIKS
jgi:hypothetical protein